MALASIKKCELVTSHKRVMDKELLYGTWTPGDRAKSVLYNAKMIVENKDALGKCTGDARKTARINENITICMQSIKNALTKLDADEKTVSEIVTSMEKNDIEMVQYILLQLLIKRNPGLYRRKLAAVARSIANRQH